MRTEHREADVIAAFSGLTDRLVDDFDVVELTTELTENCARLLDVAAVGLLLADTTGLLHLLAATSAEARELEAFQLQREEGPCLDCFHSGFPVSVADLRTEAARWPRFTASAAKLGFRSVHAIPMRLRKHRLGALGLFGTSPGELGDDDYRLAQGLAHVASIAIISSTRDPDRTAVAPALRDAVSSRAVVEMAKGMVSELQAVDMQEAFTRLRAYAAHHHQRLTDVARDVVGRRLDLAELLAV